MAKEVMVYQANPLIEGRREFSLIESRIFYLGLKDVVPRLTAKNKPWQDVSIRDFPTTHLTPKELIDLFGNDKYYSTLEEICDRLGEKKIKIKREGKKGYDVYPVFARLSYIQGEGLTLVYNPYMTPFLLDLRNTPFTKLPFEQVWALRSSYSIRLFELLLQYQNTKTHERILSVEELRQYLGVPDECYRDRMNNFRRYIVDSCVKDINQATAYKVEAEPVKEKRKTVAFKFTLHLPAEVKKQKAKAQIKDIQSLVQSTADNSAMSGQKPATTPDEKRAIGKQYASAFIESLKNSK
jgi:plasmid replication initiation protein